MQIQPASTQSGHLLVSKEVKDWWGKTGFQGLLCQDTIRTCSQDENWLKRSKRNPLVEESMYESLKPEEVK